jgi:putative endonuclease
MIDTGAYCEQIARDFLLDQGLVLIHSNYRCRYGEIDLIMLDKQLLV